MVEFKVDVFKSDKPVFEIVNKILKLETLKDNINDANNSIVSKLLDQGETYAKYYYSMSPSTGTQRSSIISKKLGRESGGYVALQGYQALYEEFGTGEEGAKDPHPMKPLFKLNPYNSGPFVSTHINKETGKHYWFYYPLAGQPYFESKTGYTEGTPSGKIMYYTSKELEKKASEIAKNILGKAIKTQALK